MSNKQINNWILFLILFITFLLYLYVNIASVKGILNQVNSNPILSNHQVKESCFNCHNQNEGFSTYHNPKLIGCTSCHLGNKNQFEKEKAHHGIVLIPGNLKDAEKTCGNCHKEQLHKITNSLMTNNNGLVAVNKFVFGESENPNTINHINSIGFTPAEKHLRDLCANCHLGTEKNVLGPIHQKSRGGGCNACHLSYSTKSFEELKRYQISNKKKLPTEHPELNLKITNEHCFGCHSRSSRISTNYAGLSETLLKQYEVVGNSNYTVLNDQRVFEKQQADVHHEKGLLCIDCHSSSEVMGDGNTYLHQEEAVSIQCIDCHFSEMPKTISTEKLDNSSARITALRKWNLETKKIVLKSKTDEPILNVILDEKNNASMISKNNGKRYQLTKQPEACKNDKVHDNLSCSSCHTSWASKCIGCHNQYDKNDKKGFDLLTQQSVIGQWVEYVHEFSVSEPSLGVRTVGNKKEIKPAVPGMIMTIDKGSFKNNPGTAIIFHRLFSQNAPHTTVKKGRSCVSCHLNPYVLGYGSGVLSIDKNQKFMFEAAYALNENDNLPEDAWIPFLSQLNNKTTYSTRINFRPFTLKEQQSVLKVGACLTCHKENDNVMKQSLQKGIDALILLKKSKCVVPKF